MRLGPALFFATGLLFLAGLDHAQVPARMPASPLQSFSSDTSQTTPPFQVPDAWEVCWQGHRNLNVSVLAADGSVAGGGAGTRGAVYLAKGGTYHLQIDYDPAPQMPVTPAAAPSNPLMPNSTGDSQNNNGRPTSPYGNPGYNPMRIASMNGPYLVDVISAATPADTSKETASFLPMPYFRLPNGAPGGTATAALWSGTAAQVNPASAPAAPSANLSQDQARAVVLIKGDSGEGTGFLVKTKDGPVVITNQHVLANNPNIQITTSNGLAITPLSFKAATDRDLAMILIKDAGYSYLTLAPDVTAVAPGDPVVTPGNSEGGEVMLNTNGKVLAIGPDRIEIDNPIYHGNSGGPVYDSKTSQVVGVVTEAIKVDTNDELDKASFSSRSSAIQGSMRYFAMRVDNVPQWEDIDWRAFQGETAFLDKFEDRNRSLDSFLNSPSPSNNQNPQAQSSQDSEAANLWKQDASLMKANDQFTDRSGGDVDTAQKLDALREFLGNIVDLANTDVTNVKNQNNFYMYDRRRAAEEMEYRQAILDELDRIGTNIDRLGHLPRSDSAQGN